MKASESIILLGSNMGDKLAFLKQAVSIISSECGVVKSKSSIYETEAWGFKADTSFLNQVILIETALNAFELLEKLLFIEQIIGRVRDYEQVYSSRTIDIDILYFGDLIVSTNQLTLPHPRLHLRKFSLVPLTEMWPHYIHPLLGVTHAELLSGVDDQSAVNFFSNAFE